MSYLFILISLALFVGRLLEWLRKSQEQQFQRVHHDREKSPSVQRGKGLPLVRPSLNLSYTVGPEPLKRSLEMRVSPAWVPCPGKLEFSTTSIGSERKLEKTSHHLDRAVERIENQSSAKAVAKVITNDGHIRNSMLLRHTGTWDIFEEGGYPQTQHPICTNQQSVEPVSEPPIRPVAEDSQIILLGHSAMCHDSPTPGKETCRHCSGEMLEDDIYNSSHGERCMGRTKCRSCGEDLPRPNIGDHKHRYCRGRKLKQCRHCKESVLVIKKHLSRCLSRALPCPVCKMRIPPPLLENRLRKCKRRNPRKWSAGNCQNSVAYILQHLEEECLEAPTKTCSICGKTKNIRRYFEAQKHENYMLFGFYG